MCDGPLTVAECRAALFGMARRKTPGCDGFPAEFYMTFRDILGDDLVDVLNLCFTFGYLTRTQRRGVISLSFKKGDRLDPRNWHPISLLSVDYKIALHAVASRLLKVIHLVVSPDQSCGVAGRYVSESVAFLHDFVSFASSSGSPVAVLSLDQKKAFDRVDWGFLRSTLGKMGFRPLFIGWVDMFYSDLQSAVKVNGFLFPFFRLSRGVRHGCPLSPLLYVLYSELLPCNIRSNSRIKGLSIPGSPTTLSPIRLYADDTFLVVTSDDSIRVVFDTYTVI